MIAGVVDGGGSYSPSPASGTWSRRSIDRVTTDPETRASWTGRITAGAITVVTSDGNPATIPDAIPEDVAGHSDPDWALAYGMEDIRDDAAP